MTARPSRLPDRKRIRGAYRGVAEGDFRSSDLPPSDSRSSRPGSSDLRTPDTEVAALVDQPFSSIEDAHERLLALEALFRERGDYRGAFLVIYARVTGTVGRAIDEGEFADPDWAGDYLVAFAELYRRALFAYERGDDAAVPGAWRVAFEAAESGECLATQAAVLGINAHVNYDLALALHRVGIDPDRETKYADHCAVNDVLHRLVDEVQDLLADGYAPGIAAVDERLGRIDEALGYFTLAEGRESAWRSAVALDSRFRLRRRLARWVLRTASTGAAYAIVSPAANPSVLDALRSLERTYDSVE